MKLITLSLFILILSLSVGSSWAQTKSSKRKIIKYRQHTSLDFSGETVQGKIRAPEVFYIFQRKRSTAHNVIRTPRNLNHHRDITVQTIKESLPK